MVELRTPRLLLRPWTRADAPAAFDVRRRPEIAKWLGNPEPWTSVEQAEGQIDEWNRRADGAVRSFAIVPLDSGDDEPVGQAGIGRLPDRPPLPPDVEIGWWLHPSAIGRGYASEAAAAVLAYGFEQGLRRIWAFMWPENEPSARVARAIGMRELGVLVDPWYGSEAFPESRIFLAHPPG